MARGACAAVRPWTSSPRAETSRRADEPLASFRRSSPCAGRCICRRGARVGRRQLGGNRGAPGHSRCGFVSRSGPAVAAGTVTPHRLACSPGRRENVVFPAPFEPSRPVMPGRLRVRPGRDGAAVARSTPTGDHRCHGAWLSVAARRVPRRLLRRRLVRRRPPSPPCGPSDRGPSGRRQSIPGRALPSRTSGGARRRARPA